MSNYQDARALFRMALADIKRILRAYQNGDFADCAFRIQFSSEKTLKGLIILYGGQF
jgi:HEPN domain-containing protein